MEVKVTGKQIDLGQALTEYVEQRLKSGVHKFFDRAISANVVFSKQTHLFRADIQVNEGTGKNIIIKGNAESDDIYNSFDSALVRIEKQLRKYKSKLKEHHHQKLSEIDAAKYVIKPATEDSVLQDNPMIIAEKQTAIQTLTVSEAVMSMDLQQLPALLFINKKNNRLNLVYYRTDGNISWVDPNLN